MAKPKTEKGFTLIELMIVVVIIGILAAIAVPNFIAMQVRAREGSLKSNMHTWQLSAEDYGIQYDGMYATAAGAIAPLLPGAGANFRNPFDHTTGIAAAWEDRASTAADPSAIPGIVSYADSLGGMTYNVKGYGKSAPLAVVLTAGQ